MCNRGFVAKLPRKIRKRKITCSSGLTQMLDSLKDSAAYPRCYRVSYGIRKPRLQIQCTIERKMRYFWESGGFPYL